MTALALAAWLLASPAGAAPELRPERVVLHTGAGDLVLALYAGAPRHADKLHALFRAGAYDSAPVRKIDPARFVAFGGAARLPGIERLPLESGGPHRAGVVSMAHQPGDPDESETAFVILLADIPGMDGRFSAVGEVVGGREALALLTAEPVDQDLRPLRPLSILRSAVHGGAGNRRLPFLLAAAFLALAGGLLSFRARLGPAAPSAALLAILAAFFAAFSALAETAAASPGLSVPLYAATVGVFLLMSRFER